MDTILIGSRSFGVSEAVGRRLQGFIDTTSLNVIYYAKLKIIPYQDITGIIAGTEPYTKELLEMMPNLKVISRMGVGYEQIDLDNIGSTPLPILISPVKHQSWVEMLPLVAITDEATAKANIGLTRDITAAFALDIAGAVVNSDATIVDYIKYTNADGSLNFNPVVVMNNTFFK